MSGVYLIHFDTPYKHAQHYLGYADNIEKRLQQHRTGAGAKLMGVVYRAGITWRLVRVWEGGDRELERRLKHWHGGTKLCPMCRQKGGNNHHN
jgi:predicted GIY-YIG superfamily endonuclease